MANLTPAQRQIADAMSTYGNRDYLPTARGGMVDENPVWQSPAPAGSAKVKSVKTGNFTVPMQVTKIPSTMWAPSTGTAQDPAAADAFMGDRLAPDPYQYAYTSQPTQNPALAAISAAAPSAIGPGPGPIPRPGYAPTAIDMAAINGGIGAPRAATQAIPPNLQALLAQNPMYIGTVRGGNAPVMRPAQRPTIAANALIDGQRGKDNRPGANYMGRSVGSDGKVRAYNQNTKQWDNLSANSKPSPSQSYKKDSMGDRDMRQSSKQKYDY